MVTQFPESLSRLCWPPACWPLQNHLGYLQCGLKTFLWTLFLWSVVSEVYLALILLNDLTMDLTSKRKNTIKSANKLKRNKITNPNKTKQNRQNRGRIMIRKKDFEISVLWVSYFFIFFHETQTLLKYKFYFCLWKKRKMELGRNFNPKL